MEVAVIALVASAGMQVVAGHQQAEAIKKDASVQSQVLMANAQSQSTQMEIDQSVRNAETSNVALDHVKRLREIIANNQASASARGMDLSGSVEKNIEVSRSEASRQLGLLRTGQALSKIKADMARSSLMTSSQIQARSMMQSASARSQATLLGSYGSAMGTLATAAGVYSPASAPVDVTNTARTGGNVTFTNQSYMG